MRFLFAYLLAFISFSANAQANIRNYLHFDGKDDYVSIIDTLKDQPQLKIRNNLTFDMWVMFDGFEKPMSLISMGQFRSENTRRQILYSLTVQADKSLVFEWETDEGNDVKITSVPLDMEIDKWYYITVTRDVEKGVVSFFLNGEVKGTYNFSLQMQPKGGQIGHCTIGAKVTENGSVYFPFKGKLDHMRVWNVVLDNDKIKKYADRNFLGFEVELIANYWFADGKCNAEANSKNTHLFDYTEHHNHGILVNFQLSGKESNWLCEVK